MHTNGVKSRHSNLPTNPNAADDDDANRDQLQKGNNLKGCEAPENDADSLDSDDVVLQRKIGVPSAIGIIVGSIVGSGIFISPAGVAAGAGSPALCLIIWAFGGIVSIIAAMSVSELGTMITASGGEFVYMKRAYADWVAFLWSWTSCLLIRPGGLAAVALTSADYILYPLYLGDGGGAPPVMTTKMLGSCIILLLGAVNAYSVNLSTRIQVIFTVTKVAALIVIVGGGIVKLAQGYTEHLAVGFEGSNTGGGDIIMAFYSAMFSYDGWYNLNSVMEEVSNPSRTLPLSVLIGMPLVMFLYVMVNVSYFTVMSLSDILASPAVAITWAQRVMPGAWWIMPIFVSLSAFGACSSGLFTIGRIFMVTAREGHQMELLSMIHPKRLTPMPGIVFMCIFSVVYTQVGAVMVLIDFLSFAMWMFHALMMLSVIVFRFKMKDAPRPYKVPIILPAIVFVFAVILVIVPIILAPQMAFLYAFLIMMAGLILYFPFVYFKKSLPCMGSFTRFMQLLMQVCPPDGVARLN